MRFYDGSELLIQNGALNVTGSATISGVLNVSGQTNLSGQVSVTGPMNITGTTTIGGNTSITGELVVTGPTTLDGITDIGGDTTITGQLSVTGPTNLDGLLTINGDTTVTGLLSINGDTTVSGTLGIEGITTLSSDLNVVTGGKITAGSVVVDPTGGGRVYFADGEIRDDGALGMFINNPSAVRISTGLAVVNATSLTVNATKTLINGELEVSTTTRLKTALLYLSASLPTVTYPPNLYVHTDGRVYRSTWTP